MSNFNLASIPESSAYFFERTRQRPAEAREVRTAFDRIDVVDIRMDVLRERIVVLHGHFDRHAVLFGIEIVIDSMIGSPRVASRYCTNSFKPSFEWKVSLR